MHARGLRLFIAVAAFLGLTLVACAVAEEPTAIPSATVVIRPLPLAPNPDICRGMGMDGLINGAPDDPRVAWIITGFGRETPLVWPAGWTARFGPTLEIVDASGSVRFRRGDIVSGICLEGPPNAPSSLVMISGL